MIIIKNPNKLESFYTIASRNREFLCIMQEDNQAFKGIGKSTLIFNDFNKRTDSYLVVNNYKKIDKLQKSLGTSKVRSLNQIEDLYDQNVFIDIEINSVEDQEQFNILQEITKSIRGIISYNI